MGLFNQNYTKWLQINKNLDNKF